MTPRLVQSANYTRISNATLILALLLGATLVACRSGDSTETSGGDSKTQVIRDAAAIRPALDDGFRLWQTRLQSNGATYFYWRVRPGSESGVREVTGV